MDFGGPKNLQKSSGQVRHWAATSAVPGSILLVLFGWGKLAKFECEWKVEVRNWGPTCQGVMSFGSWIIWFFLRYKRFGHSSAVPNFLISRYVQIPTVFGSFLLKMPENGRCKSCWTRATSCPKLPFFSWHRKGPQEAGCFRPLAGWDDLKTDLQWF